MNGSYYAKNKKKMHSDKLVSSISVQEILARSVERKTISRAEACELMNSNEDNLIISTARHIRNNNSNSEIITYSRKVFIELTNLCRDSCSYCTYKKDPYNRAARMMTPPEVIALAEAGKKFKCTEALLVTGERPEQKYEQARDWLKALGHTSIVEYIAEISENVLRKTGLLPHTNAGSLTKKEMSLLKDNNVSLGMMLESSSQRLSERNMPHHNAPSKNPKVRIRTLEEAGQLKIPFTTGLLLGIGESDQEIIDSLYLIKEVNKKYGHIQEVILQNFAPKPDTGMEDITPIGLNHFLKIVGIARIILQDMNIQVPPNLNPDIFGRFLDAGINDWGGISPVTIDYVNPEFPWPSIKSVRSVTLGKGFCLRARLPVYPEFILHTEYISDKLRDYIKPFSDSSGLVREDLVN
jgi:7,8-didemethyl-8-hydroxy-5-deazariboflavin synthase